MIKRVFILALLLLIFTIPVMAEDQVIAVVQGQEITRDELDTATNLPQLVMQLYQMDQYFAQLLFSTEAGQNLLNEYRKVRLDEYIIQVLLNQEVEKRGITLTKEEQYAMFKKQLDSIMIQNNFTEQQLLSILQEQGFQSIDEYQEYFLEQNGELMVIGVLRDQVVQDVSVEDSEVQEYYLNNQKLFKKGMQIHARHILLKTREEAEEVLAQIKAGADFIEMAKKYSAGPTGPEGGDLGFFGKGQMVQEFEEAAFALEVGEISNIVESEFGFHIIRVDEIQPETTVSFEEAKGQLKIGLLEQKKEEAWGQFLEDLRSNAVIELKL